MKTSKLRVTDLCERNSPVTSEFPTQMASNVENTSIWWRHHTNVCAAAPDFAEGLSLKPLDRYSSFEALRIYLNL